MVSLLHISIGVADCSDEFRKIAKVVNTTLIIIEFYSIQIIT